LAAAGFCVVVSGLEAACRIAATGIHVQPGPLQYARARDDVRIRNIVFLLQLRQSFALFPFLIPVKARFLEFMIGHCRFVASRDEP
jgi:hypothetical protein